MANISDERLECEHGKGIGQGDRRFLDLAIRQSEPRVDGSRGSTQRDGKTGYFGGDDVTDPSGMARPGSVGRDQ
jgi:hypothetical protein